MTYKPPKAKMEINATFCFLGSSSLASAGIGITRIARSVTMCIAALLNQSASELRQEPGTERSQNLETGMQFRNALMTAHVPYVARIASMVQQVWRIDLEGKTRRYCIRMEALAHKRAAL